MLGRRMLMGVKRRAMEKPVIIRCKKMKADDFWVFSILFLPPRRIQGFR